MRTSNMQIRLVLLSFGLIAMHGRTTGMKIIGGFMEVKNVESSQIAGVRNQWGNHSLTVEGRRVVSMGGHYCWNPFWGTRGYCYQKLVVSTANDSNEWEYQILGGRLEVFQSQSRYIDRVLQAFGKQAPGDGEEDVVVSHGEAWSAGLDTWGYAYYHFIIKQVKAASTIAAVSYYAKNHGNEQFHEIEVVDGKISSSSKRVAFSYYRCHSPQWNANSVCYQFLHFVPTYVVDYKARTGEAELVSSRSHWARQLTISNDQGYRSYKDHGHGTTETFTRSSSARFSKAFDFDTQNSISIEIDVAGISVPSSMSVIFESSKSEELIKTKYDQVSYTDSWPTFAIPGLQETYVQTGFTEVQQIPVEFTFSRNGRTWTETNYLIATLRHLSPVQLQQSCCLSGDENNPMCNGDRLPICGV